MKKVYLLSAFLLACCLSCSKDDGLDPEPPVVVPEPEPDPDPEPIVWKNYISYLDIVKDSVWADGKGETFLVKNSSFSAYVIKDSYRLKDGIYPGLVVDVNPDRIPTLKPVPDVEYNPITFGSWPFVGAVTTEHPAESMCTEMKEKVLASSGQINSFSSSSGRDYHSAKELYMLFAAEGIRMDSIMNGRKYSTQEMKEKHGVLYNFKYTAFTIDMDLPQNGQLLKKDPEDYTSLKYVNSISYGVIGCMTIESDSTCSSIKALVNKVKDGEELTEAEKTLVRNLHVRTALFNAGGGNGTFSDEIGPVLQATQGMIREFFHPGDLRPHIGMLDIHFANYNDHGVDDVILRIDAPVSSKE